MSPGQHAASLLRRHGPAGLALSVLLALALALPAHGQHIGLDLRDTVTRVLAYTRWPVSPDPLRVCFAGASPHAERLQQQGITWPGGPVVLRRLEAVQAVAGQCDVLYIGALDIAQWQQLAQDLEGQPVLTLCERSPPCLANGMVRLDIEPAGQSVRFEINLDALARGKVRIHPQVLRLGRERKP
nr:YfiR family protein [Variovorax boronicumulans]